MAQVASWWFVDMTVKTLQAQYLAQFGIEYEGVLYHDTNTPVREMDFWIRNFIGKTDDIESLHAGRCSHQAERLGLDWMKILHGQSNMS